MYYSYDNKTNVYYIYILIYLNCVFVIYNFALFLDAYNFFPIIFCSFFLEKNMLSFFLRIMRQKCGSYVCVQLLQTLNILFENIRNETSLCKCYFT